MCQPPLAQCVETTFPCIHVLLNSFLGTARFTESGLNPRVTSRFPLGADIARYSTHSINVRLMLWDRKTPISSM